MFSSLSLSLKLILGFISVSIIVFVVGVFELRGAGQINDMLNSMYTDNLVTITDIANANMQAIYQNRGLYDIVIETNKEEMLKIKSGLEKNQAQMEELLNKYRKTLLTDKEVAGLKKFDEAWPVYQKYGEKVIAFTLSGDNENATKLLNNEATTSFQVVDDILSELVDINVAIGKKAYDDSDVVYAQIKNLGITGIAVGFIISFGLGFFISRSLSNTLRNISQSLYSAGEQVASASTQLSAASQQVSAGTTESASSLEETVASIEELTSMVNGNANNAREAATLAQASAAAASQGDTGMQELIQSMNDISEGSKKVEDIITVIDDISFQINLLALNAAVEAARAGEQGRGFAVVADAVRSLAQKSAEAAKDIAGLITDSVQKTGAGTELASKTGASLKEIVSSIQKATNINQEIATASAEQATGISQISKAMQALDTSTQQNASASEEVSAAAEEMSSQAMVLQQLVVDLSVVIEGKKSSSPTLKSEPSNAKVVKLKAASPKERNAA